MAQSVAIICDGCGTALPNGGVTGALVMNAYDRVGGGMAQLHFGWDCANQCGHKMVNAARTLSGNPHLGPDNVIAAPSQLPAPDHFVDTWTNPNEYPPSVVQPHP